MGHGNRSWTMEIDHGLWKYIMYHENRSWIIEIDHGSWKQIMDLRNVLYGLKGIIEIIKNRSKAPK